MAASSEDRCTAEEEEADDTDGTGRRGVNHGTNALVLVVQQTRSIIAVISHGLKQGTAELMVLYLTTIMVNTGEQGQTVM